MNRGQFERFVGVDLGGGKGKKTALAVLERRDDGVAVVSLLPRTRQPPLYDPALIELLRGQPAGTLLCVDAPLTLPPCLRCTVPVCPGQDRCVDPAVIEMRRLGEAGAEPSRDRRRGKPPVTPYTQRPTEVYLHRGRGILPRETLGQGMGPLTARAVHLQRALADRYRLDETLIEVYPKATLAVLGPILGLDERLYKKSADARLRILERMSGLSFAPGVWREACVQSDHAFDAIVCAYTGYLYARDAWTVPAECQVALGTDGWIWVPPAPAGEGVADDEPAEVEARRRRTLP